MALLGAWGTQQRYRQAFQRGRIVEGARGISCVFLSRGASSVLSWDVMSLRLQSAAWRSDGVIQRDQALTGVCRSGSLSTHYVFLFYFLNAIISYMECCLRYQGTIV